MRVGAENEGWKLMTTQLNHERVALSCPGKAAECFEETLAWARQTGAIEQPWVQLVMARLHARLDALKLLNWKMAWELTAGQLEPADASAVKVFGTELFVEVFQQLLDVVGSAGALKEGSPGAILRGRLEHMYRHAPVMTFGGGVNEVQREIIATAGLGLPRAKR
jgi:alkylation response protein AidB-like acyl-CoA dehydrogenase